MADASRYALSPTGTLVCISDVDADDRYAHGPYSCLACDHVMVPELGRVRKHHFKHKAGRPVDCLNETYLHQLAKKTLFEAINNAMVSGQEYLLIRHRDIICDHYAEQHNIVCTNQQMPAYSGTSGHPFRSHPATCSDAFGHL
jgi:competence CoiA-like predicted nuclease